MQSPYGVLYTFSLCIEAKGIKKRVRTKTGFCNVSIVRMKNYDFYLGQANIKRGIYRIRRFPMKRTRKSFSERRLPRINLARFHSRSNRPIILLLVAETMAGNVDLFMIGSTINLSTLQNLSNRL